MMIVFTLISKLIIMHFSVIILFCFCYEYINFLNEIVNNL